MPRSEDLDHLRKAKPSLRVFADFALNAEACPDLLDDDLTPVDRFFVRNNGTLPAATLSPDSWTLSVNGCVARPTVWTLADLRARFEVITVTAVLECAGNGRAAFAPPVEGIPWTSGAVGCARWTGVRLADVLAQCEPAPWACYTGHVSPDVTRDGAPAISRGLPIAKAMAPETILAFAMNGEPLPLLHGSPLRVVAPGFPGSAWQKWLTGIQVRDCEHDGPKMTGFDYRLPIRPVKPGEILSPEDFAVITAMPVKSIITAPRQGDRLVSGAALQVRGATWSGVAPVVAVDVTADGGRSWHPADLDPGEGPFAWRRFAARLPMPPVGQAILAARAADASGAVQPLDLAWNPRGYCNNAVHRVEIAVAAAS